MLRYHPMENAPIIVPGTESFVMGSGRATLVEDPSKAGTFPAGAPSTGSGAPGPIIEQGFQRLRSGFTKNGLVPYYPGLSGSPEASVLALVAFAANGMCGDPQARVLLEALLSQQNADGSIGSVLSLPAEGLWVTSPFAVAAHLYGCREPRDRAIAFLHSFRSVAQPDKPEISQNNALVGWTWMKETFGWVEPTAWAVLALRMSGAVDHPHTREGIELILDRQIDGGGWNCGNRQVYNTDLLPFLDTTGLALLALVGLIPVDRYRKSVDWINSLDPTKETLYGKAFGLLALRACGSPGGAWEEALRAHFAEMLNQGEERDQLHFGCLGLVLTALGPEQPLNPAVGKGSP